MLKCLNIKVTRVVTKLIIAAIAYITISTEFSRHVVFRYNTRRRYENFTCMNGCSSNGISKDKQINLCILTENNTIRARVFFSEWSINPLAIVSTLLALLCHGIRKRKSQINYRRVFMASSPVD